MKNRIKQKIKKYEIILAVTAAILIVCGGVTYAVLQADNSGKTKRIVTFYDQGKKSVVITQAGTVHDALKAADITVSTYDQVEPSAESGLDSKNAEIIIYRSRLIAIAQGSMRQSVATVAQSPNAILKAASIESLGPEDRATFGRANLMTDGTLTLLTVERAAPKPKEPEPVVFKSRPDALTVSKGAQVFVDSVGVAHRETYYDLPMNIVIGACGAGGTYTIRSDGAKVDQGGYVLVAANLNSYPRCSVVETSLGPGKVYDTGGFAVRHPYGFDLATDWTNYNGR